MTRAALILAFVGGVVGLSAQAPPPPDGPTFEVASVKPLPRDSTRSSGFRPDPTRWSGVITVANLVGLAYQLPSTRIVGAPRWASEERYEINARTAPRKPGDIQSMMRHLLAERFALKAHRERRPIPIYALLVARSDGGVGPGLQRVQRDCTQPRLNLSGCGRISSGVDHFRANGLKWEDFVLSLETRITERPVVDKTGLSGLFDITLEWNPDITRVPEGVTNAPTLAELEARPVFFTAIREQLGLALESDTTAMDVVVIDSVERPTPD
jgi:uncharacterized protein (TIGR03435 family)